MAKWKAPLPKDIPPKGESFILIGMKTSTGSRLEISGKIPFEVANQIGRMAQFGTMDGMPKPKPPRKESNK